MEKLRKENWEMLDRVRAFTEKYQMIRPGDRIVAGISGGADSVCLLFLLAPGHLLLCRSNPRRMGVQKAQYLFLCHPVWNPCHDSSVQPYLKCHCFAL